MSGSAPPRVLTRQLRRGDAVDLSDVTGGTYQGSGVVTAIFVGDDKDVTIIRTAGSMFLHLRRAMKSVPSFR